MKPDHDPPSHDAEPTVSLRAPSPIGAFATLLAAHLERAASQHPNVLGDRLLRAVAAAVRSAAREYERQGMSDAGRTEGV